VTAAAAAVRASCTTALDAVEVTPHGAVGAKTIRPDEPYLSGHYPGNPVYPGVFLLDLCEKVLAACPSVERPFDRVDSLRFFAPVLPGDQVRIEVTLRRDAEGVTGATVVGRAMTGDDDERKRFTVRMSYA
jgi:3-hydroxymyristoyl/3-hydroxydecanoyl-(acyl carrier protein) dehydratase